MISPERLRAIAQGGAQPDATIREMARELLALYESPEGVESAEEFVDKWEPPRLGYGSIVMLRELLQQRDARINLAHVREREQLEAEIARLRAELAGSAQATYLSMLSQGGHSPGCLRIVGNAQASAICSCGKDEKARAK
jgi:hypothetical protein